MSASGAKSCHPRRADPPDPSVRIVSAVVGLIGLVAWLVVLPPVRPIDWSADSALRARIAILKDA